MGLLINKGGASAKETCLGGRSFGCRHDEHPISTRHSSIMCYRCGERMGCFLCVASAGRDLICLNCNDWALEIGTRIHGPVVGAFEMRRSKLAQAIAAEGGRRESQSQHDAGASE